MKKLTLLSAACRAFPDHTKEDLYAAILCGEVYVNGEKRRDPQTLVPPTVEITRRSPTFVSRGGIKLDYALSEWHIDVHGLVVLDVGSSTGGFTDCLLARGATHVHAVDVGTNQLAYRLRSDSRVSVHERTNIMSIDSLIPEAQAAVADLSFRSLRGAAAHTLGLARDGWAILLVKPQFELRGVHPDFDGVIRSEELLQSVLTETATELWEEGVHTRSIVRSPILGRRGNKEYLFLVSDSAEGEEADLPEIVKTAL